MSARTRIPPALELYLRLPPEATLILLTGTLGCDVSWLTARFAGNFLTQAHASAGSTTDAPDHMAQVEAEYEKVKVALQLEYEQISS